MYRFAPTVAKVVSPVVPMVRPIMNPTYRIHVATESLKPSDTAFIKRLCVSNGTQGKDGHTCITLQLVPTTNASNKSHLNESIILWYFHGSLGLQRTALSQHRHGWSLEYQYRDPKKKRIPFDTLFLSLGAIRDGKIGFGFFRRRRTRNNYIHMGECSVFLYFIVCSQNLDNQA